MRKNAPTHTLLYLTLKENTYAKSHPWDPTPPTIYCSARQGKTHKGNLKYYFAPIPEFHHNFIIKCFWKQDTLYWYIQSALDIVRPDYYYLHPDLRKLLGIEEYHDLPPMPLLEAMLNENEKLFREKISTLDILLPTESLSGIKDTIATLLYPYLSRINSITLIGGYEAVCAELADFFYSEFGILTTNIKRPNPVSKCPIIIDLWSGESDTLKFLDTMVKNGYNRLL